MNLNQGTDEKNLSIIIRHGEKGADVPGFIYPNKHDSPLTPLGV